MMTKTLSAFAVTAVATAPAMGALVESFEDGAPGDAIPNDFVVVDSGAGITDGTQAARRTVVANNAGFEIGPRFFVSGEDFLGAATEITYDLSTGPDTTPGGFLQFVLGADFGDTGFAFNSDTQYAQVDGDKGNGDSFVGNGPEDFTISFDAASNAQFFTQLNTRLAAGGSVELAAVLNKATNAAGTFTIDNVQINATVVPEPASLAILGLGGVALLSRRRK